MKKVIFAAMMALSCTFAFAGTNPTPRKTVKKVQVKQIQKPEALYCRRTTAGGDVYECWFCNCKDLAAIK